MGKRTNHLVELRQAGDGAERMAWLAPGNLCVMDRDLALHILDNRDAEFVDHSDFFGRLGEPAPDRSDQRAIAREIHRLASSRLAALKKRAVFNLPETSDWPDFGFALVHETMATVLVSDRRSAAARNAFNRFVRSAIMPEKRGLRSKFAGFTLVRKILSEVNAPTDEDRPDDILSALADWRERIGDDACVRIFLSALFSIINSLSLALAWAVYHFAKAGGRAGDERAMIRESMRLTPIAWMLERYPAGKMRVGDVEVDETTTLLLSPYLLQRRPGRGEWEEEFDPTQWRSEAREIFWMPFGHGDHKCPAASLSVAFIEFIMKNLRLEGSTLTPLGPSQEPLVSAVLRPRPFRLTSARAD